MQSSSSSALTSMAYVDAVTAGILALLVVISAIYAFFKQDAKMLPGAVAISILAGSMMIAAALKLSRV